MRGRSESLELHLRRTHSHQHSRPASVAAGRHILFSLAGRYSCRLRLDVAMQGSCLPSQLVQMAARSLRSEWAAWCLSIEQSAALEDMEVERTLCTRHMASSDISVPTRLLANQRPLFASISSDKISKISSFLNQHLISLVFCMCDRRHFYTARNNPGRIAISSGRQTTSASIPQSTSCSTRGAAGLQRSFLARARVLPPLSLPPPSYT